uniref:Uncharacterized protein n=1 Tax=Arundo donax TaxID=35708 RepID=A0A0A8YVB5_ARUDO
MQYQRSKNMHPCLKIQLQN